MTLDLAADDSSFSAAGFVLKHARMRRRTGCAGIRRCAQDDSPFVCKSAASAVHQPFVLLIRQWHHRQAELTKQNGIVKHSGLAHGGQCLRRF